MAGKEFITTCTVKRSCEAVEALFHEEKARKSYALNRGRERRVARSNGSSIAERLSFRARLPDNPKLGTVERIQLHWLRATYANGASYA